MKIQTDQLTALQQTTEQSKGTTDSSDAFAALLAQKVGSGQTDQTTQTTGLAAPPLSSLTGVDLSGLQETDASTVSSGITEEEQSVMENMDTLLAQWQNYADQLAAGTGGDSLKQAYGVLENIETGVKQLKDDLPSTTSAGLGSLVNELEVMTVTEKIKFNRGDYI
ncbi:MAG: hypothetical protein AB9872_07375 [Solidesulfovibrio sp.]